MSRRKLLCTVEDAGGDTWGVTESRPTALGFPVLMGRPLVEIEAGGRGGPAVIPTRAVIDYLTANRKTLGTTLATALGISKGAIGRLRKLAGINRYADARRWWTERIDDLRSMTLEGFAARHGVKMGAVEHWRLKLIGKVIREPGWYDAPEVNEALLSPESAATVGTFLGGIPAGSVSRLRSQLAAKGEPNPVPSHERIARNKTGMPIAESHRKKLLHAAKRPWSDRRKATRSADLRERGSRPIHPERPDWTPAEDALLGTTTDRQVAIMTGRPIAGVRGRRQGQGIPAYRLPWGMPIPRTPLARSLGELVKRRYETISGAVRATGIDYKVLYAACDGRKGTRPETLDRILATLHATRAELDRDPHA